MRGRQHVLIIAILFVVVFALYFPTLRGGFVYDSIVQVLHSDYIHTSSHWGDVLTLRVVGQDELDRNRPLHLASLMFDAAIWGRNPFGYRLTSVLLHALNAALLFVFLTVASQRGKSAGVSSSPPTFVLLPAVFGALLFALHPLVVEAVAEPSNREDLLVLLPVLVGLLGIAAPIRSSWIVNALLVICTFFAVLAKESGLSAPFIFVIACRLLRRADFYPLVPGLVGGLVVSFAFLIASYVWRPVSSEIFLGAPASLAGDWATLLAVQMRIWTLQLLQILWPVSLSAHYPPQAIAEITMPVALVTLLFFTALAAFLWRGSRLAALGIAVYGLTLLPASNFFPQFHPLADRYLYAPLSGVGMIAAALLSSFVLARKRPLPPTMVAIACVAILAAEYRANLARQRVWRHAETLWADVARTYPRLALAQIGMANAYYRRGEYRAAFAAASEAVLSSQGRWDDAIACKAVCAWSAGLYDAAIDAVRHLLIVAPDYDYLGNPQRIGWSKEQAMALKQAFAAFSRTLGEDLPE